MGDILLYCYCFPVFFPFPSRPLPQALQRIGLWLKLSVRAGCGGDDRGLVVVTGVTDRVKSVLLSSTLSSESYHPAGY